MIAAWNVPGEAVDYGNGVENAGRRVRQYIYKSQWRNAPPPGRREGAAAPESPAMQEAIQGNKQP